MRLSFLIAIIFVVNSITVRYKSNLKKLYYSSGYSLKEILLLANHSILFWINAIMA